MKLKLFVLFILTVYSSISFSQITEDEAKLKKVDTDTVAAWKHGGIGNLNFSQTSLTNWAAGGLNSVSLNGLLSLFENYKDSLNVWDNTLDFGLLRQKNYKGIMKTDDRIEFNSKYGRKAFKEFYYAGLLNFRTQFAPGYNYPNDAVKISDFFCTGLFAGSCGIKLHT